MTYEEYLADNQRLRKRIIELEQENARHKRLDEPLLSESKSPTLESRNSLTKEEEKEIKLRRRVNLFRDSRPRWRKCTAREKLSFPEKS